MALLITPLLTEQTHRANGLFPQTPLLRAVIHSRVSGSLRRIAKMMRSSWSASSRGTVLRRRVQTDTMTATSLQPFNGTGSRRSFENASAHTLSRRKPDVLLHAICADVHTSGHFFGG